MYSQIAENPAYEPKYIIRAIGEKFRYKISYGKAYRAKKVMEMRWSTYEASYKNLPALLNKIAVLNPSTYYDIKTYPLVARPGKLVLQWSFLALGPCIEAFRHCRPVICIDGTFLTGKYKGTILTAVAAHGNNRLFPLAIAFAEGENGDSWYWFLERLKQMVVKEVSNVCVIHDRHKGILQAMNDIKEGSEERNRAAQWPDVHSRWCIRHMGANFHNQFKNKQLCLQNQERKFNEICVTKSLKLIPYYCLNHSTWPLSNNIEVTCRLCRAKPGKPLTSQDRQLYIKMHMKAILDINKSQIITYHPSKVHYYKPSLLHEGKWFRV
jgi:hypothetical protein